MNFRLLTWLTALDKTRNLRLIEGALSEAISLCEKVVKGVRVIVARARGYCPPRCRNPRHDFLRN